MALGTVAMAIAGCGGTVNLSADFPAPMTQRLPLTALVQYPEGFREFSHVEEALDTTRWTIALGQPSMRMLDSILGSCLTLEPLPNSMTWQAGPLSSANSPPWRSRSAISVRVG